MIAAARRQNYAAAAHVPGSRRPLCMVDYCVYFCYRAALALITALPLRVVFSLGNGARFYCLAVLLPNLSATRPPECGNCLWRGEIRRGKEQDRSPPFPASRRESPQRDEAQRHVDGESRGTRSRSREPTKLHRELRSRPASGGRSQPSRQLGVYRANLPPYHFGYARLSTVYQKLGNRHLDRFVRRQRARFGVELFDRSEGFAEADPAPARRWGDRDFERSARGRPWPLDAVLRAAGLDFAAPGAALQTHRRRANRRLPLYRRSGEMADDFQPALRSA